MISIKELASQPASVPVLADDIIEFHASRLLLLLRICGKRGHIDGLTKLAKLDFFVRYPQFFAEAIKGSAKTSRNPTNAIESAMVRHHYGPWDYRYYHILAFLLGTQLIDVSQVGKTFRLSLTNEGMGAAKKIEASPAFTDLVAQMRRVKAEMGNKNGSTLKKIIYETFSKEVAERERGEVIY